MHQKSLYLTVFNATMISRSVGRSMQAPKTLKEFKKRVFQELEKLTDCMDQAILTEDKIITSIQAIADEFQISFGQAQKPINVILKIHFYLTKDQNDRLSNVLHCPLDSVILGELKKRGYSSKGNTLTKIDRRSYLMLQQEIGNHYSPRIKLDDKWDEQHLKEEGLLGAS